MSLINIGEELHSLALPILCTCCICTNYLRQAFQAKGCTTAKRHLTAHQATMIAPILTKVNAVAVTGTKCCYEAPCFCSDAPWNACIFQASLLMSCICCRHVMRCTWRTARRLLASSLAMMTQSMTERLGSNWRMASRGQHASMLRPLAGPTHLQGACGGALPLLPTWPRPLHGLRQLRPALTGPCIMSRAIQKVRPAPPSASCRMPQMRHGFQAG